MGGGGGEGVYRLQSVLKDQQMHFGFMYVILLYIGQHHVSATPVVIFRVLRTTVKLYFFNTMYRAFFIICNSTNESTIITNI